jgi:hypothetical protein
MQMNIRSWLAVLARIAVLGTPIVAGAQTPCQSIAGGVAGVWHCDGGCDIASSQYNLSQDSSGNVTGSEYTTCGTYSVAGTFRSADASYSLTSSGSGCPASSWTLTGNLYVQDYCSSGSGSWTNDIAQSGTFQWYKDCDGASSETRSWVGWDSTRTDDGDWQATVGGGNGMWGGRTVAESPYQTASDTCYIDGSPNPNYNLPENNPMTSAWVVDDSQHYTDQIGWGSADPTWYRTHGRAPCGITLYQQMTMYCYSGGRVNYAQNTLGVFVDSSNISSCVNGECHPKAY